VIMLGDMNKRIVMLAAMLTACAGPEPGTDQARVDSVAMSPGPVPSDPDSAAVARYRGLVPDSVLERRNACPFECCVYGSWVADTTIPMYSAPRSQGRPAFTLARGDSMKTEYGAVYVTSIGLIVVEDSLVLGPDDGTKLLPGDTLVLLDPIGEGYWTAWRRGEIIEQVPPFFESWWRPRQQGRMIGRPAREWWVRATSKGRTGWFTPDIFRVRGADSCA
jgi:hypothetical protein